MVWGAPGLLGPEGVFEEDVADEVEGSFIGVLEDPGGEVAANVFVFVLKVVRDLAVPLEGKVVAVLWGVVEGEVIELGQDFVVRL